jgi:hypothetical protein
VKGKEAQNFFLRVFTDQGKPGVGTSNERSMSKSLELFEGRGRGSDLASANGTAFGLLNAVTEFVDHERKARSVDNRLDSAWFGQGASIKQKALEQALLMAA